MLCVPVGGPRGGAGRAGGGSDAQLVEGLKKGNHSVILYRGQARGATVAAGEENVTGSWR